MENSKLYLVTGAAGNLGSAIVRNLTDNNQAVRAFVLPGEEAAKHLPGAAEIIEGDITNVPSLDKLFAGIEAGTDVYVIHCAAMVSVSNLVADKIHMVNVDGTRNVIDKCLEYKVKKLVYVSSTGAIPEKPMGEKIREVNYYNADKVIGLYDKTKAEASQMVLNSVAKEGLDACIINPSGISGPGDYTFGNVAGVIRDYTQGKMPAGISGTFNCGDSRDMARAIIRACELGRRGESYILSGDNVTMEEVFKILSEHTGLPMIKHIVPGKLGMLIGKGSDIMEKITHKPQRMTSFAVYNLIRNNDFDSSKAIAELGYAPRSMDESIADEIEWMKRENMFTLTAEKANSASKHAA